MDYKKEYIKMRNSGDYDLNFFYNYYLSKGGSVQDHNQFSEYFLFDLEERKIHPLMPPVMVKVGDRDRQGILDYMDSQFGLIILNDKNNKFIKVVC